MKWYFNYSFYCNKMTRLQPHCIFCIFSSTMRKLSAFYEQLYILIVSGCLFHPNYSQDMAPVYQREPTKVMDYAIIHKQDSAPKFVIFLTLAFNNFFQQTFISSALFSFSHSTCPVTNSKHLT